MNLISLSVVKITYCYYIVSDSINHTEGYNLISISRENCANRFEDIYSLKNFTAV